MYEPCLCGAIDCPSCGPMQGYRVPRRYPYGRLSAEDCDILNAEYYAEQAAADAEAEAAYERDDEAEDTDIF
jgi:ssDNA-binding Zn-finger/Zn-ribbon topoisomerase 1